MAEIEVNEEMGTCLLALTYLRSESIIWDSN